MDDNGRLAPGEATEELVQEMLVKDGVQQTSRPSVAGAVRNMLGRRPLPRANGIFQHPSDWTQEEMNFIADCLKQNIPIYTIANMVRCERHALSRLIANTPDLRQLKEDKYENLLDEAEYQADRLMKAGNSAIVIHVLSTLGRKRGWGTDDGGEGGGDDEGRIVMGTIPAEEVEKANKEVARLQSEHSKPAVDAMQMALTEEAVKAEVDRRMKVVEAEGSSSSPIDEGKGGGESTVEVAEMRDVDGYMQMPGMGGGAAEADPWADGANSVFFQ